METIKFKIGLNPISDNKIWKGQRFKSKNYENWRMAAYCLLQNLQIPQIKGWIAIESHFYIHNFKRVDVTNYLKSTFDALVQAKIIEDDRFVKWERSEKWPIEKGEEEYFTIEIYPIKMEDHQ